MAKTRGYCEQHPGHLEDECPHPVVTDECRCFPPITPSPAQPEEGERTWESGWCPHCVAPRQETCERMRLIPAFSSDAEYSYSCHPAPQPWTIIHCPWCRHEWRTSAVTGTTACVECGKSIEVTPAPQPAGPGPACCAEINLSGDECMALELEKIHDAPYVGRHHAFQAPAPQPEEGCEECGRPMTADGITHASWCPVVSTPAPQPAGDGAWLPAKLAEIKADPVRYARHMEERLSIVEGELSHLRALTSEEGRAAIRKALSDALFPFASYGRQDLYLRGREAGALSALDHLDRILAEHFAKEQHGTK